MLLSRMKRIFNDGCISLDSKHQLANYLVCISFLFIILMLFTLDIIAERSQTNRQIVYTLQVTVASVAQNLIPLSITQKQKLCHGNHKVTQNSVLEPKSIEVAEVKSLLGNGNR